MPRTEICGFTVNLIYRVVNIKKGPFWIHVKDFEYLRHVFYKNVISLSVCYKIFIDIHLPSLWLYWFIFQGCELLWTALRDPSERVVTSALHVFLPSLAAWAEEMDKLQHSLIHSVVRDLEELVKAIPWWELV